MAKIISIYAKAFFDQSPSMVSACSNFKDISQINEELQGYVIESCELGLMGYRADGTTVKPLFNPNTIPTRAEVATVISRLLRRGKNQGSEQYRYQNHLIALHKAGIINSIEQPMILETRGNVFLMLMRIDTAQ